MAVDESSVLVEAAFRLPTSRWVPGLADLSASARASVLKQATDELASRAGVALASHLVFLGIVAAASGLHRRLGWLFLATGLLLLLLGGARAAVSRGPTISSRWWCLFAVLTSANAWVWGACALVATLDQGLGGSSLVFWIMNAGIAAGGASSLKPNPALARWFVVGLMGPIVVAAAIVPGGGWSVSLMLGVGTVLLFALGREVSASYWNGLIKDAQLTERSQELEIARSRAEAALAGREVFFASVSQELRAPLNAILGGVRVLTDARLPEELAPVIKGLVETGGDLHYVVNQILDYARISTGLESRSEEPVDVIELLDDALEEHGAAASGQGLVLASSVDEALPPLIIADPRKLKRILGNLLSNAIRYSDTGTVSVRAVRWADASGNWLRIYVDDEGVGLTDAQREQLFLHELTGERLGPRSGVGLGLAIARRQVEECGGQIGCEKRASGGTTFWFTVPLLAHGPVTAAKPLAGVRVGLLVGNSAVRRGLFCRLDSLGLVDVRTYDHPDAVVGDLEAIDVLLVQPSAEVSAVAVDRLLTDVRKRIRVVLLEGAQSAMSWDGARLRLPVRRSALLQVLSKRERSNGLSIVSNETEFWPLKRGLVLVVSDNTDTALRIRALLHQLHFEVVTAEGVVAALSARERQPVDAVILDLGLPRADDLARAFRSDREVERASVPPVLGFSSQVEGSGDPQARADVSAVLGMPLSIDELAFHLLASPGAIGTAVLPKPSPSLASTRRPLVVIANNDPVEVHLIKLMLRGLYEVEVFRNGESAVKRVADGGVALVLMDLDLEGMGGYEATHAIKQIADHFLPVILITDQSNDERIADSLSFGADFSIARPLNPHLVRGKIAAALRIHKVFEETERQRDELGRVQQRTNEDLAIAERILRNILAGSRFDFSSLRLSLSSVERFNGDLAMVLPLAGRRIRFFLGDFTGHGLGAAVGAMPVGDIFLAITKRGLSIETALREMNSKLRRIMPRGMFLSALAGELDVRSGRLVYWNGGLPDAYVLRPDGTIRERMRSKRLPIGISSDDAFDSGLEVIQIEEGDRIFACTDGVMETADESGKLFGEDLLESVLTAPSSERFWSPRLDAALDAHRGGAGLRDDTTYLEIHFDDVLRSEVLRQCCEECGETPKRLETLQLSLSPAELRREDPLVDLRSFLERQVTGERTAAIANSVVSELVVNAIDHGLLGLESSLKDGPGGFGEYFARREERLASLEDGTVAVQLGIKDMGDERLLKVRVEDTGRGFVMPSAPTSQKGQAGAFKHGRGLELVKTFARKAVWSDGGRVAEAELLLEKENES